jgi:hypothetical protein
MRILTKNVKFGDCNLIIGDYETMLVDCGSANRGNAKNSSSFAFSQIREEIENREIDSLMISHFDTDHFNGILQIPNDYRFENVYLPYSIADNKAVFTSDVALMIAIAPENSWGFKFSKKLIELFVKLPKISRRITFLKRGDRVCFDGCDLRVLWPQVQEAVKFINPITKQEIMAELGKILDTPQMPRSMKSKIFDIQLGVSRLNEAINYFENTLDRYLLNLLDENDGYAVEKVDIEGLENAYFNLVEISRSLKDDNFFINQAKPFYYKRYHSLINNMNAISLVCDCNAHFALLGDAPPEVIDYIKAQPSDTFAENYGLLKVQHHATTAYFTNSTPKADVYIISNGGFVNRKIDERFLNLCTEVVCTQFHEEQKTCQYFDTHNACNPKCRCCCVANNC